MAGPESDSSDSSSSDSESSSDSSSDTEADGNDYGHIPGPGANAINVAALVQGAAGGVEESAERSEESAEGSDEVREQVVEDERVDHQMCFAPPLDSNSIRQWRRLAQLGRPVVRAQVATQHVTRFPSVRRMMWECAAMTFHPDILVRQWSIQSVDEQHEQLEALRFLFDFWSHSLFRILVGEAAAFKRPPPEMFQELTFDEFRDQYIRLRDNILPRVLQEADCAQCWKVERVLVRLGNRTVPVCLENVEFVEVGSLERAWGGDRSLAFGCDSCAGQEVYVSLKGAITKNLCRHGSCAVGIVVGFEKHILESQLYKKLMSMAYQRVHDSRIWHVLRMYHRLIMAGCSTEALAEMVGSMLSLRVRTQNGQHRALSHTIASTRLRCFGVVGDPRDVGFLSRSLDIYFRGKPWHFCLWDRERNRRDREHPCMVGPSMALHNHRVGLMSHRRQFSWLSGTLNEAVRDCGRVDLGIGQDHSNLTTPKAGLTLKESRGSLEMFAKLAKACRVFEPRTMDVRVIGGFGT